MLRKLIPSMLLISTTHAFATQLDCQDKNDRRYNTTIDIDSEEDINSEDIFYLIEKRYSHHLSNQLSLL